MLFVSSAEPLRAARQKRFQVGTSDTRCFADICDLQFSKLNKTVYRFGIGFKRDRLGFWAKILTGVCQFFPAGEGTNSSLKSLLWNLAIKHRDQDVLRIEN
jgi:hypothetical protein